MLYRYKMQTKQVNLRVPSDLLDDLDIVSKLLKVNKSEWIKTKLAEEIHKEKNQLLLELSNIYTKGIISKKEVRALVGSDIANQMESIQKTAKRSVKAGIEYGKQLKKAISA